MRTYYDKEQVTIDVGENITINCTYSLFEVKLLNQYRKGLPIENFSHQSNVKTARI